MEFMTDNRKKYQHQAAVAYPHVGKLVESYLDKHMSNRTYVGRQLGVAPTTVSRYFENESLQLGILWKLSLVTNHNFVAELGAKLPIDYTTPKEEELLADLNNKQNEIEDLKKQIERLNIELSVYKNIVGK
jgi:hypothetical protein